MKAPDLVCLGRAAVDLYGEELGTPLEDVLRFRKSLGGSAANVAVCAARQGLRVAMLTKVGNEAMGRFVRRALAEEGIDVSAVKTDPTRLTALVLLAIRDPDNFPLIFYRERCADMALSSRDVPRQLLERSRGLLLTGTHLSTTETYEASTTALTFLRRGTGKAILDLDYRPVLWGMAGHGGGASRYVASERVSFTLRSMAARMDLVVGTEDEIRIAGGCEGLQQALETLRQNTAAIIVLKLGPRGCAIFSGPIPPRWEDGLHVPGQPVDVLNVLGAGDAFLGGFLRGWLRDEPLERCAWLGNTCGALVVSRHECSPAMPTKAEVDSLWERSKSVAKIDSDLEVKRLHWVGTRRRLQRDVCVLAFDHRRPLELLADASDAPRERIHRIKVMAAEAVVRTANAWPQVEIGAIADAEWGSLALSNLTARRLWVARPIERAEPGPLRFLDQPTAELLSWPGRQVVKVLVDLHPDHQQLELQLSQLQQLQAACQRLDREWLLELLPRPSREAPLALEALGPMVERVYQAGLIPDWWKLPPVDDWRPIQSQLERFDPHCRGILVLGQDAPEAQVVASFAAAKDAPWVRGFAVGRTIFAAPAEAWLRGQLADEDFVARVASAFSRLVAAWLQRGDAPCA